ncbi:MAG: type IV pilin [Methanoculleus sp.]
MKRRTDMRERDDAVSPVIGVMLMLVVTIIIAAVVSGFAGGLMTSREPAPSANFDVSMTTKSLELVVRSASEDIPSKDITIVLSKGKLWRKLVPKSSTVPFGFNIVEEVHEIAAAGGFKDFENVTNAPSSTTQAAHENNTVQWFGNYTLKAGSRMSASDDAFIDLCGVLLPEGLENLNSKTKGEFLGAITEEQWEKIFGDKDATVKYGVALACTDSSDYVLKGKLSQITADAALKEALKTALPTTDDKASFYATAKDKNWRFGQTIMYGDGLGGITVSPGDRVTVSIVHTPSGQTMFTKTVTVKGA